ncbi:MAG: XTP/dITP diphosphatase [Clostridia bacterium]|nr:XTP/dITP diphosphatase [Clostridia bacterium]
MTLVLATNNQHKVKEIKRILGDFFPDFKTMGEMSLKIDVEETGETFEENSFLKADAVCKITGCPSLADDSGLCVRALNGEPGVYSARYAGDEHDDDKNIEKLLRNMNGKTDRGAEFVTVITLLYPDGKKIVSIGKTEGEITFEKKGTGGFGYDPVFYSYDLKKTFAEASEDEKNAVSHRGRALRTLEETLRK